MKSRYDGYEVGRRLLKIAPLWLLLCLAAFVAAILLFGWMSRPVGRQGASSDGVFKNEAMNQPKPVQQSNEAHAPSAGAKTSGNTSNSGAGRAESSAVERKDGAQPASPQPSSTPAGAESNSYSVQVGAFDDRSQANEVVSRLRAAGFDARVVESDAETRLKFQVRSGSFPAREDAARLASQLRAKRLADETVIVEPAKP
jgi:cell division septation protein DedD